MESTIGASEPVAATGKHGGGRPLGGRPEGRRWAAKTEIYSRYMSRITGLPGSLGRSPLAVMRRLRNARAADRKAAFRRRAGP